MLFPAKQRICPSARPDLCLATIPPGGRSGGWDRSIWEERTPSERSWRASPLREAVGERRCREEVGVDSFAEAAAAYGPDPKCPGCGAWREGSTAAGVPRWRCRCCGRRFNSLTGTVLEHCRKPLPAWVSFIRPMCLNAPVECAAKLCGVTHKTSFEWRHRVLATVSGYQDRTVLRDTVWVDKNYINDATSPRAMGSPSSAAYPTIGSASASPSEFKRTPTRLPAATGSPARRG